MLKGEANRESCIHRELSEPWGKVCGQDDRNEKERELQAWEENLSKREQEWNDRREQKELELERREDKPERREAAVLLRENYLERPQADYQIWYNRVERLEALVQHHLRAIGAIGGHEDNEVTGCCQQTVQASRNGTGADS